MRPVLRRAALATRLVPYLLVAAVAAVVVSALVLRPEDPGVTPTAERVVVAGASGLRWDDVDPQRTPHLWELAQRASIGSLSVRSAHSPTCPADGWLTLGAGNWAGDRAADRMHQASARSPEPEPEPDTDNPGAAGPDDDEVCPPLEVALDPDNGAGAQLQHQEALVRYNQQELPWGAMPGALAGSVDCTVAFGQGAAVAGARSFGRVDRYSAAFPEDPEVAAAALADRCELGIVDLGAVQGEGAARAAAAARVDAALGRVLAARPPESLVLVAGVADVAPDPHLHVAVADGPGLAHEDEVGGWLTSATTGRTGYLQLVDVAPTVLTAVGRPMPQVDLSGSPVTSRPGRPAELDDAVTQLVAADRAAERARPVATGYLGVLTVLTLVLLAAMVVPLRRPEWVRRGARWRRAGPVLLVAAALAIPAALAAGAVPWWRAEAAGGAFTLTSLAVIAAGLALVAGTPAFRRTLGLVGAAAAVAAAAVAADLLTGSWLQLNGVVGYSAHDGGRFAGLGEIGLGVLIASTLLVAGCLAEQVSRRRRPLVVIGVGAVGVVLAGSPYLGANIGGAVAMLVGVCLTAALCTGGWLTARRMGWAGLVGLLVVAVVAGFDLAQPADQRTGLGSMLAQLADGTAGFGMQRVSLANAEALVSPLTVLAVGAGAFLWLVLRPWGGLKRLFGVHPALRAGVIGIAVASLLGGILVGAALQVAGAAAAVGVPLVTLAVWRLRLQQVSRGGAPSTDPRGSGRTAVVAADPAEAGG